jgi:hypothetical protein
MGQDNSKKDIFTQPNTNLNEQNFLYSFKNQTYKEIIKQCEEEKIKFIDELFPPNLTSIFSLDDKINKEFEIYLKQNTNCYLNESLKDTITWQRIEVIFLLHH